MTEANKPTVALFALLDFVATLPENYTFECSWASYAMSPSIEEELLDNAIAEMFHPEEYPDHLQHLGNFAYQLAHHARTAVEQRNAVRFCQSVLAVLTECHLRENDALLEAA